MSNWLLQHLPRLVPLLHRYVVHVLTTAYRALQEKQTVTSSAPVSSNADVSLNILFFIFCFFSIRLNTVTFLTCSQEEASDEAKEVGK